MKIGVIARKKKRKGFDSNDNVSSVEPVRKKQKRQGKLNSSNEHAKKQNLLLKVKKKSSINNHKKENNIHEDLQDSASLPLRRVNSIFYKLSKPGFPDSYLFGTVHAVSHHLPGLSNFHPEESEGFKNAEQIFVECHKVDEKTIKLFENKYKIEDVFQESQIKNIKKYLSKFNADETFMSSGHNLRDNTQYLSQLDLAKWPLDSFAPLIKELDILYKYPELNDAIKTSLSIVRCENNDEENKELIDERIANVGSRKNKKVYSLATIEEQFTNIGKDLNTKYSKKIVRKKVKDILSELGNRSLRNLSPSDDELINLIYIQQNVRNIALMYLAYELQTLDAQSIEAINANEDEMRLLPKLIQTLALRNIQWIEKILPKLKKSSFISVGYAHFFGKNGLIQLFEKEGFTVKPLECPRESLTHEIQFSKVMKELKSKSSSILDNRFLKPLNSEHDKLPHRHEPKQAKSTSYLPGYQHQQYLKTVDKGIVIDKIDGVSMYRLV